MGFLVEVVTKDQDTLTFGLTHAQLQLCYTGDLFGNTPLSCQAQGNNGFMGT